MPRSRPLVAITATLAREATAPERVRVRTNAAYTRAVEEAGLVPLVVPPLLEARWAADALAAVEGLVLTGGEDVDPARYGAAPHPALGEVSTARDATELALVAAARERRVPVLAICRGIQLLNVALGGTLVQDLPSERPSDVAHDARGPRAHRSHAVTLAAGSHLAAALGATQVTANSMHHQALDRVAAELRVTATAPDGIVEGVESTDASWWVLGVQWHPEELTGTAEEWDRGLFAAFARAVNERR